MEDQSTRIETRVETAQEPDPLFRIQQSPMARWKDKAQRLEVELAQMKARERAREAQLATLKKSPVMR